MSPLLMIEICDHRYWEVNEQCPYYDMYRLGGSDNLSGLSAGPGGRGSMRP